MASQSLKKLNRIHRELLNRVEDRDENVITEEGLIRAIEDIAGMTERTVNKYRNLLISRDRIEQMEEGFRVLPIEEGDDSPDVTLAGETAQVQATIDAQLKKKAQQQGMNFSKTLETALMDRVMDWEKYFKRVHGWSLNKQEIEFIRRLVEHPDDLETADCVRPGSVDKEEYVSRRTGLREEFYKEIFDKKYMHPRYREHIEDLRQKSFRFLNHDSTWSDW